MRRSSASLLRIACVAIAVVAGAAAHAQTYPLQAPPPVPYEAIPPLPPGTNAYTVWRPGRWRWDGRGYVWVPGRYVSSPRPGAVWAPGHWVPRHRRWVWVPGHWR
jgi:hypothetical protein